MAQETAHFSISKEVGLHNTDLLESALDSMPGVTSVEIDKSSSHIAVGFQPARVSQEALKAKIEILGYPVEHT